MGWKIAAIVFWVVALVLITIIAAVNVDEVKTLDLGGIKTQQIIAGTNLIKPDFEVSSITGFTAKSYSLVMAGVSERGEITLLGLADNQYYKAVERFPLNMLQAVKEVRITDRTLTITCGKNGGSVFACICLSVLIFGAIGGILWSCGKD